VHFHGGDGRTRRSLRAPALAIVAALLAVSATPRERQETPPRVARPGFAYDPVRRVTVLFGGVSDEGAYPGTWEWNGAEWRERKIAGPSPRANHGMTYDARRRVIVLFGGEGPDGRTLGDTWEYDGVAWRRASERGPSPRAGFGIAYDGARGRTVIHGGFADGGAQPLTDTWVWDGSTWTRVAVTGPSGTTFHRMVYDAHRQRVVAFGGRGGGGETWEWDGSSWTKAPVAGPPPRDHHAMAYDSRARRVVVFGGGRQLPGGGYDRARLWLTDLWAWDGEHWTLRSEEGPPSRGGQPGLAYDAARDRLVLFGGGALDGTWEWTGAGWERRR